MSNLLRVAPKSNFYIQEFISPWWVQQASSPEHILKGLELNNPAMLSGTQLIRDHVASSVTINNWHIGGAYEESCLRTPRPIATQKFALFSGHMFWKPADMKFISSIDTADVAELILRNPRIFYMIEAIENPEATRSSRGKLGRDWLHVVFGYRMRGNNVIRMFNP